MKPYITFILLFVSSFSLLIPSEEIKYVRAITHANENGGLTRSDLAQGLDVVAPKVRQLILIFKNITNQTETELSSMFDSQDHTLALFSLQFWSQLLRALFVNSDKTLADLDPRITHESLLDILETFSGKTQSSPQGAQIENFLDSQQKEIAGFSIRLQKMKKGNSASDQIYSTEVSYETLQKWIDDYGLSASSLRDYLETYLFAGDHRWTTDTKVDAFTQDADKDKHSELRERLISLGENIQSALATPQSKMGEANSQGLTFPEDQQQQQQQQQHLEANEHFKSTSHKPFVFEIPEEDRDDYKASSQDNARENLSKRSLREPPVEDSLVYSFSRLDLDQTDEFEQNLVVGAQNHDSSQISKHRIFDNDRIVDPISLSTSEQPTARSKEYRQVIYDAQAEAGTLTKRSTGAEEEKDCVPVTWYNVFHHSVFGKHKFCHV